MLRNEPKVQNIVCIVLIFFAPAPVETWNTRFSEVQNTFVPNNKEEDRFSAGINVCHRAVFPIINKCMLSLWMLKSYCFFRLQEGAEFHRRGELSSVRVFFMLLTGVRVRTSLWRLPPVSEICHYHGGTWGKGEAKSKIEKGCRRFFLVYSALCVFWRRNSQQAERFEAVKRSHWYAAQTVVAQDSARRKEDNMLAGRQMWKYCLRPRLMRRVFYGNRKILFTTAFRREK